MYRIIISNDKKSIRYIYDGVETVISIDSIRESDDWKNFGVITIVTPNPYDPTLENRNSLTRSAFVSRFLHNEYDTIEKDAFHQYDKDIFKLYCLLEGKEVDVDTASENLISQRKIVDEAMRAWKNDKVVREVDATVAARNTMADVSDRVSVLEDINSAKVVVEKGHEDVVELLEFAKEGLRSEIALLQEDISKNIAEAKRVSDEKKPFLQSTEMAKIIALAEDVKFPHVTLENVKLEDITTKVLDVKGSLEEKRISKEDK